MTREEIYENAMKNYRKSFPNLDAYEVIASRLCMSVKNLQAKVRGERHFTLAEEEQFFIATYYPLGFILKANFLFHQDCTKLDSKK